MTADSAPRSTITDNCETATATATRSVSHDASNLSAADEERGDAPRPSILKQRQTDRPQPTTKASLLDTPGLTRRMTTVSLLNEALWSMPANNVDAKSSSSEDEGEEHNRHGPRRTKGRHGRNDSGQYSKFHVGNDDYQTEGRVRRDGRLNISVNETNNRGYLAKALGATFLKRLGPSDSHQKGGISHEHHEETPKPSRASSETTIISSIPRPTLNIVVMVIGSRGDIQPFLKLGRNLKEFGHRVRIATHPAFKDFVQKDSGLEFFSVGGDPAELMAFMVKNPGMIPTMNTLIEGEVSRRRDQMAEMFEGFWRACINATDDEKDEANLKMMGAKAPFVADAIIANPPSFAHIHCAERLGIPLHIMFTFPYTPTKAFPHPLANIKKTNVDLGYANFMSYPLVEMMTWQGLGDLVNNFRVQTLGLEPVSTLWAPGQLYRLKVPYTYLWSPGLVPKPEDWGPEIDIAGFVFLDLASSFEPPEELMKFLDGGDPPVYIGFGSIVVDDPDKFTKMIFEAVKKAGVRALVSKGWGGLGDDNPPEYVHFLGNIPHDWLFPKVSCVVHHGGAGTTAIGLKCGRPSMVVPFFGDQQFWGAMIGEAGAGAKPVPYKSLTAEKLAEGIKHCLTDKAREAAAKIAKDIEAEGDGAKNAVDSFHRSLILRGQHSMRCSILEDRVAVWNLKNTNLRLSALAAELLVERKKITRKQLRLIRHNEWNDFEGPGEPLSGSTTAMMSSLTSIAAGVGSVPFKIAKTAKRRSKHEDKKRKSQDARRNQSNNRGVANDNGRVPNGEPINGNPPDGKVWSGKPENSEHPNGQTNGITKDKGKKRDENNDGQHDRPPPKDSTNHIPASSAPGRSAEKATQGPDMGKHTESGEPMSQKQDANNEAEHEDDESDLSEDPEDNTAEEIVRDIGEGAGKTAGAIARAPMDLSLALAQGFHNAPRLYGDPTVRRPTRITGIKSGLKAAGQEFAFGVYDGVSGLVTQPYNGARDNGAVGFIKGVGMGLTGFVLKDLAAIFGPFGYTFKGIHKELLRSKQPTMFIRKARILEGQRDLHALDEKETRKTIETVCNGFSVVLQVWGIMEEKRSQGLRGRIHVMRDRKTWRANGAFENVEMAKKAIEATRKGESLDGVFAQQKAELKMAQCPRKSVVQDMNEGKDRKDAKDGNGLNDEWQIVETNQHAQVPTKEVPSFSG